MERRSRSQTRRNEPGPTVQGALNSNRHASSSRVPETSHGTLSYPPPQEQARTLSPDRRDRYRASGRGYDGGPASMPAPRQDERSQYLPSGAAQGSVPNSASNSYNQYNGHPLSSSSDAPPPRPNPPTNSQSSANSMNNHNSAPPPRPEPPNGYIPSNNNIPTSNNTSPTKVPNSDNKSNTLNNNISSQGGEKIAWEFHHVTLQRVPGYGFGIAVSGGRDNPHFTNGDPSIAISDVLKAGPAEGKLMINDRVISANNISLEGVDYATAVQVLRDSGQFVNLVVKRRVVLPSPPEPQNIKVSLVKNKKKEDFGVVLGCKIYIKEIAGRSLADKDSNLQEGDFVHRINNISLDGMTLKEAKRLIDSTKEKLDLTVKRDPFKTNNNFQPRNPSQGRVETVEPNQNLYVPPPTRKEEKNNIARADQLQKEEALTNGIVPPRPPLPREEGSPESHGTGSVSEAGTLPMSEKKEKGSNNSDNGVQLDLSGLNNSKTNESADYGVTPKRPVDESSLSTTKNKGNLPDPRFISFRKEGSVGIRLTGGNDVGIFVTAVQPGSPAAQQGLQPGDKIIKVNDMDMMGVTREEAVLFLLSLQDQIDLIAQYRKDEYDQIVQLQRGDSFYIKAHFNYEQTEKGEMSFKKSDVFHVVDTLHNGVVGSWQAFRMDPFLSGLGRAAEQVQKGVIPNKSRAEEIATQQFNAAKKEQNTTENSKSSFFKRKKAQNHRRSKSLGKDHWEDLVWSESMSKFPAYERVSLRHPGFPRPVVIFGPVSDIARERLLRDFPLKFASPQQDTSGEGSKSGIVRLSSIRDIMDRGRHALLDVTPNAVDKLNYAQFYPVVILVRADSKQTIKDCRSGLPKKAHLSSKKLLEQCQKVEKMWGHVLTSTLSLHSGDNWYNKLTDLVEKQQTAPIWMSDSKPDENFSDDFLFPMTARLSYTSAAESDGEFCGDDTPRRSAAVANNRTANSAPQGVNGPDSFKRGMSRASSDPSLVRQDGTIKSEPGELMPDFSAPPPYSTQSQVQKETKQRQVTDGKYGNRESPEENKQQLSGNAAMPNGHGGAYRSQSSESQNRPGSIESSPEGNGGVQKSQGNGGQKKGGPVGPVLPPKIDRQKKPSKKSAAERLFGRGSKSEQKAKNDNQETENKLSSNNMDNSKQQPSEQKQTNFHSMPPITGNGIGDGESKKNTYDSSNSSNFDSYNKHGAGSEPGYAYSRSISQPPPISNVDVGVDKFPPPGTAVQNGAPNDKYRYSDYKPMPPPKSTIYKPVPPPKPKPFTSRSNSQPPSMTTTESNYINGHYITSSREGEVHNGEPDHPSTVHYHSSRVPNHLDNGYAATNGYTKNSISSNGHSPSDIPRIPNGQIGQSNGPQVPQNGNRPSLNGHHGPPNGDKNGYDIDNNGVDSGQGSSLDRDYSSYNGNVGYSNGNRQVNTGGRNRYAPPPGDQQRQPNQNGNSGQYYYNLPNTHGREEEPAQQQHASTSSVSPRRGAQGDTLDLSNREYRGSAFELYKKPGYSFPSTQYTDMPI